MPRMCVWIGRWHKSNAESGVPRPKFSNETNSRMA
uniref:Uncharacterized protein n=1 Tax=Rhizophora mucronata TaxID=61149 RepID=A0A2P2PKQ6_RHIMU